MVQPAEVAVPMEADEQRDRRNCSVYGIRDHEPFRDVRLGEEDGIGVVGGGDDDGGGV